MGLIKFKYLDLITKSKSNTIIPKKGYWKKVKNTLNTMPKKHFTNK